MFRMASSRPSPHNSGVGGQARQNDGRSDRPKRRHSFFSVRLAHRTPAGLPLGMLGIAVVIDGAMQQAPHFLQFMGIDRLLWRASAASRCQALAARDDLDEDRAGVALGFPGPGDIRDPHDDGAGLHFLRRPEKGV